MEQQTRLSLSVNLVLLYPRIIHSMIPVQSCGTYFLCFVATPRNLSPPDKLTFFALRTKSKVDLIIPKRHAISLYLDQRKTPGSVTLKHAIHKVT